LDLQKPGELVPKAYEPAGLEHHGIHNVNMVYWNLPTPALYEEVVRRREGIIAHLGALVVRTGHHTGRSPDDKLVVKEASSKDHIWWGTVNRPIEAGKFDSLYNRLLTYLRGRDLFVQDCFVGADERYQIPIRIISEYAWHSLFARNLFIRRQSENGEPRTPEFTVIDLPRFHAVPTTDGTHSEVFIIINFDRKLAIIGGTSYAGEIKKSIFTVLNYRLPLSGILSMHCSANVGKAGDVAIFFGLSGTGKTTLSADPSRGLIGDDEHGWSDLGVFNLEGGCYAKVIRLSKEAEPQIYSCSRRFGTVLENVAINSKTRRLDLDDDALTENTRAAYPLGYIDNAVIPSVAGHPRNIIMLTCDAFGVMPPIARLTPAQAMYHFLSGYTAKVAGTEKGLGSEPSATFSTCFGAPFMVLQPAVYAGLLGEKIERHQVPCWLVNTGWTGGPFGVGRRMNIGDTRAIIHAALNGKLTEAKFSTDPVFGFQVPQSCEGIPSEVLDPRSTWADKTAYDRATLDLAGRFEDNFKQFEDSTTQAVREAGPRRN
jgi:phosphoenolpyruvate carboxykinase (ATP)